jgi:hypothetical protein
VDTPDVPPARTASEAGGRRPGRSIKPSSGGPLPLRSATRRVQSIGVENSVSRPGNRRTVLQPRADGASPAPARGITRRGRGLALLGCTVVACQDSSPEIPPFTIETDRARIALDDDYAADPPCRGDLEHIDAQVARVEDFLGVQRTEPVSIYLGDIEDFCTDPDNLVGCYRGDLDMIFTAWAAVDHEIVHAVARDIEFPSRFLSEGTAELLSGSSRRDTSITLTPADLEADVLYNYVSATHFSRFVVEVFGRDAFLQLISGVPFDDALGITPLEATQRYEDEAPYAYPSMDPCPYPALPSVADGVWQETVEFTCDSPEASGFEFGGYSENPNPTIFRTVHLEAGEYEFDYDGGIAPGYVVLGCFTDVLDTPPAPPPSNGDLFNEIDGGGGTWFPGAGRQILAVTEGTYRVALLGAFFEIPEDRDPTGTFTVTRVEE